MIVDQEPLHLRHDGVARRRVDRLGGAGQDRIVSRKQKTSLWGNFHNLLLTPSLQCQDLR